MQIELEERIQKEKEFLENDEEDEELYSEEDFAVEFFYLWDTNKPSFDIFRLIRPFINADGVCPEAMLVALAQEFGVKLQKVLEDIPLILHGYNKVISSAQTQETSEPVGETEEIPFN